MLLSSLYKDSEGCFLPLSYLCPNQNLIIITFDKYFLCRQFLFQFLLKYFSFLFYEYVLFFLARASFKPKPMSLAVLFLLSLSRFSFFFYSSLFPMKGGIRSSGKNATTGEFLIGNHTAQDKDSFWRSRDH